MNRVILTGVMAACLGLGCDGVEPADTEGGGSSSGGGGPTPTATPGTALLLVEIDPEPACGTVGVTQVQLVARRVGCESPPPAPCTVPVNPPAIGGDTFTCPNTDPSTLLGVELEQGGRYQVQTVIEFTTGETEVQCNALGGDPEIVVSAEDVEAGIVLALDDAAVPCP